MGSRKIPLRDRCLHVDRRFVEITFCRRGYLSAMKLNLQNLVVKVKVVSSPSRSSQGGAEISVSVVVTID